jgi:threonine aldolase
MNRPNFASDNQAPVHPRVMEALLRANTGFAASYGYDAQTVEAEALLKRLFGDQAIPFPVLTGTGANVLALGSGLRPWEGVLCADFSHANQAETGAPEWHLGTKLILVPTRDAKLRPSDIQERLGDVGNEHHVQPRVVSITQAAEYGTLYRPEEVRAIADAAHIAGLLLHMDGARLSNAAAALGLTLAQVSSDCGVDVLSLGATKNGAMGAEAVLFFRRELAEGFLYRRKQAMQLASKMRYVSAQLVALFGDETWRENARHANAMATRLGAGLAELPGIRLTQPVETNQVFASLPADHAPAIEKLAAFHVWQPKASEYRFVCSFATTAEDVDGFLCAARGVLR